MGWKLRRRQWTGTTEQLIEEIESAYDNAPNMFSIRIHHGVKFQRYPGRMYVSGRVDIFDMVDIDLFTVVALNMMVLKLGYTSNSEPMFYNYLKPLTSLDEGLYALACEEDVRCLGTLVRSFKLIRVYIEHGVTALDSYLRAPRFRATLEEITDEPGIIAANRTEKMLLLTWHESSETTKEPVCESVTPNSLPQYDSSTPCKDSVCESITPKCMPDCILTPPTDESVITYTQLSGVQGVDTQSHVLSTTRSQFCDINLSFVLRQATTSQVIDDVIRQLSFDDTELDGEAGFTDVAGSGVDIETQSKLPVSEEPDVGRTQEPILSEVGTQEPIVAEVSTEEDESAPTDGQFFYDDEGIDTAYETEYDVQSSEDAGTDDDDDVDKDFCMDLPFDNIGVTNLVPDDVLEGEDVDVINADGFDSDPGNDEEKNYKKRRLAELRTEMEVVINASGQWKMNLKLYKNDGVKIRARCDGKVLVFIMSQGTGPTGSNRRMEAGPSGSSGPTTRSKKRKNTCINDDSQSSPSFLDAHDKGDLCHWVLEIKHCTYKFLSEKIFEQVRVNPDIPVKAFQDQLQVRVNPDIQVRVNPGDLFSSLWLTLECLGDDIDLHSNLNFTFISDRQKGWCGQAYKDLLWRVASATNIRDFEKCMLELKTINPKAHEWLNKIPAEHWARSHFSVRGRDKLVITLLEYIREYCMKRIVNVQGVIDKCTGPLTSAATRIMESIKKEAHLMKVGRPRKKRKRSKHEDEPFVKDGKLSRKGRTITCQSCGNTGHNKATCKGQGQKVTTGGNNAKASGSASRQAQETEPVVGQDGSGRLGVGVVIGLSVAAGEGGAGVVSQGSSYSR
ncbi:hypothetical protein Tco_0371452 [Tanacetum coccineum]